MYQVLFTIPFTLGGWFPDGIPGYGFGAMLFLTFFVAAMWWGPRRSVKVGLPKDRLQDLAILVFLLGIGGARLIYMIQYADHFKGQNLFAAFFQIWNGGIVFYGSVFGGALAYYLFYRVVLRRLGVSGWKLADALAPMIAVGMALGRIGCYLNGCCWGQPVCVECQPVPLSPVLGQFPLMPAHAREQVIKPAAADDKRPEIRGLQTSAGFAILPRGDGPGPDPRSVVAAVEPGSAAERVGLKAGDRVVEVNGRPNNAVLELRGPRAEVDAAVEAFRAAGGRVTHRRDTDNEPTVVAGLGYDDPAGAYRDKKLLLARSTSVSATVTDVLNVTVSDWPRGRAELAIVVNRGGERVELAFTPRTVPFFPTQVYETVSMVLLTALLIAFQPFRRHDGQVLVLLMIGYACHRFLNEAIRIEPTYALGLTLSQWISVGIFAAAVLIEMYLRWTMPKLPPGEVPMSYGAPAIEAKAA